MSSYELERTRRELGIPDGEQVASFTRDAEDFNPEWAGFRLEFFGVVASKPSYVGEYPYAESTDGVGVRVWRLRIRKDGAQAYIEALSRGMLGYQSIDLRNLDPLNRTDNQDVLTTGTGILYKYRWRGRRYGDALYPTREAFHAAYHAALDDIRRRNTKPSRAQILHRLHLGKSQFSVLKNRWPIDE